MNLNLSLWKFLFNRKPQSYLRGLAHPQSALKFLKEYSSEYKEKQKKLSQLFGISENEVNKYFDELSDDGFYEYMSKKLEPYKKKVTIGSTLNPISAPVLYVIARIFKPQILVETGVSSGISSSFVLKALSKNNSGMLYSIDLPNASPAGTMIPDGKSSGWVIPNDLKARHKLIIGDSKDKLPTLLESLKKIDYFFHDSLHTYEHMMWEFKQAWNYLKNGGLLLSDDISWNDSFSDFIKEVNAKKTATFYAIGVVIKD